MKRPIMTSGAEPDEPVAGRVLGIETGDVVGTVVWPGTVVGVVGGGTVVSGGGTVVSGGAAWLVIARSHGALASGQLTN
jgi:hypothetical protein